MNFILICRNANMRVKLSVVGGLMLLVIGLYAHFIEPFMLQAQTVVIPVDPQRSGSHPLRIGVISDIHLSKVTNHERRAVDQLMALSPDIILMPGDMFQGSEREFQSALAEYRRLLSQLSAPGGVFLVMGNNDRISRIDQLIEGTEIQPLNNQAVTLSIHDRKVTLCGVELVEGSKAAWPLIDDLEDQPGNDDLRIILSHTPDVVLALYPHSRMDLVVAGHTHGGQVRLPWIGSVFQVTDIPRKVAGGGYHVLDGRGVFVSRGVGWERDKFLRVRFLCRPEVSVLILTDRE